MTTELTAPWSSPTLTGGHIGAQEAFTGDAVYFHTDALGSVVAITDDSGEVTDTYSYDDWGNTTHVSVTDPTVVPFAYTGQPGDPSGLVHSGRRYYQPPTGRWTQPNPLGRAVNPGQAAEANPYLYAGANPTNFTDPTGMLSGCGTSRLSGATSSSSSHPTWECL